jgi:hypothetical protein
MPAIHSQLRATEADDARDEAIRHARTSSSRDLDPLECARNLVLQLLPATGLGGLLDHQASRIYIGAGNWISCEFRFRPEWEASPDAISNAVADRLTSSLQPLFRSPHYKIPLLQRIQNSFRRALNTGHAKKIRGIASSPEQLAWFRTNTRPSLHFCIYMSEMRLHLKGHIDAAAPLNHPLVHLLQDFLPAHGIGHHPTPEKLWSVFVANSSNRT